MKLGRQFGGLSGDDDGGFDIGPRIPLADRHFTANWSDRHKLKEGPSLAQVSFMIVDPSELMRQLLRDVLRTLGSREVMEAADGSEAIRKIQSKMPEILVTEWDMVPMNGLELTRYIRTSKECKNHQLPIVMMSAYSETKRVCEARDSGVTEYLIKPLSAASFYTRIRAVIEHPRPFVTCESYHGPDRRRHIVAWTGAERRALSGEPEPWAVDV